MADQVQAYQESLSAVVAAQKKAEAVVERIAEINRKLQDWRKVMISNGKHGFPPEISANMRSPTVDVRNWPTADQLEQVLVDWHNARQAAQNAWLQVPLDRR